MPADPTLEFLKDLDNPAKWVCIPNAPVNRPHKRGKAVYTDQDMTGMANTINNVYKKSGVPVRVTIGHIKQDPNEDETNQPPIVGYAKNAKPGKFGPGEVNGLLVDLYIRRGEEDVLRQHPFRSMEVDPETKRIYGIALLTRDPMLDLGVVTYTKGRWTVVYEFPPGGDKNEERDEVAPETAEPAKDPAADEEVEATETEPPDDGDKAVELDDTSGEEAGYQAFVKCMQRYIASGGMASMGPMNGGMPVAQAIPPAGESPAAYQRDKPVSKELDTTVADLKAQVAAMRRERDEEAAKRLLDPLKEILKFNYAKEAAILASMPSDKERIEHVTYMRENYAELPTARMGGPMIQTYAGQVEGRESGGRQSIFDTPKNYDRIMAYMHKHKVEYVEAEEKINAADAASNNGIAK